MRLTVDDPRWGNRTGRDVRVAVIDSGIHAMHPHIGHVADGVGIDALGEHGDHLDRLGHGTAVAAAICEKAPGAELLAVKVFDQALATSAAVLAAAIAWSAERRARLINLSLGTAALEHRDVLGDAIERARRAGAIVVAAREADGLPMLPGSLPGVASVDLDWELPREVIEIDDTAGDRLLIRASGYPRPIPGVPKERNLSGISFAVANATGVLARMLEAALVARTVEDIVAMLAPEGGDSWSGDEPGRQDAAPPLP
ncbi:MAG TPA: S8 family serine peptidase [Gemmatimonadaceae bacterium]|nr:S8 family serine peptidase [Gemmatimonadaceae bacterium]